MIRKIGGDGSDTTKTKAAVGAVSACGDATFYVVGAALWALGRGGIGALADGGSCGDGAGLVGSTIGGAAATSGACGVFADKADLTIAVTRAGWGSLAGSVGAANGGFATSRDGALVVAGAARWTLGAANAGGSGGWIFVAKWGVGGTIGVSTATSGAYGVFADETLLTFTVTGARRGWVLASACGAACSLGAFGTGSTSSGGAIRVGGAGIGALWCTAVVVDALRTGSTTTDGTICVASAVSVAWALG